jgi:hypothetical protein|tara:strand:- start:447 stop:677 length:231 start_codon:yes stop_codon:yes gene_type:complete
MENFRSQPGELYVNTFNIEKAISEVSNYTTREELSFEVNDALDAIMAEVYEMRRTLKPMLSEDNKARVAELKGKRS